MNGPTKNAIVAKANSGPSVTNAAVSGSGEEARNSRRACYFYCDDVVRDKLTGLIGTVLYDSSSDDDDDKEQEEVSVLWLDDTEEIMHVNDVMLLDRVFLHGDYVASNCDPRGQVGAVQDVHISVDLLARDGSMVKDVPSRDLKPAREFEVGEYVVSGSWVGRVDDVTDLSGFGISFGSLQIKWISSAGYGPDSAVSPKNTFFWWKSPKHLKLLPVSCFPLPWQVGDCCLLPPPVSGSVEDNLDKAYAIINTSTRVDVVWQDGTMEHGMDSKSLIRISSPADHEKLVAHQYVVEKQSNGISETRGRRCGVIQSVNAKNRTVRVKWSKSGKDSREFDTMEEIVSVYELQGHPDYGCNYGDMVVRLSPVSVPDSDGKEPRTDQKHSEASSSMSWVGYITDLKNGDIEVAWADGMVSTVGPQEILVVDGDDDVDSIFGARGCCGGYNLLV